MSDADPFINYARANQPKVAKPRVAKKNKKPEKEVEKTVMGWLRWHGFSCDVIESKAVFSAKLGRYMHSQAVPGMADIIGNNKDGIGIYIELKAPGKISNVSEAQDKFIREKIETNCFACVVDSSTLLEKIYQAWVSIGDLAEKRLFLIKLLERSKNG